MSSETKNCGTCEHEDKLSTQNPCFTCNHSSPRMMDGVKPTNWKEKLAEWLKR